MKRSIVTFFCIFVILILIIAFIPIYNYYNTLDILELETKNMEYGNINNEKKTEKNYEMHYESFECENEFLNSRINEIKNSKIESFMQKYDDTKRVFKKDIAVFVQVIDTYKVNDNIVSVKLTTKIKDIKKTCYNTEIDTINFNLTDNKEITLDELFKDGYKEKISDNYSDKYVLTKDSIVFLVRRK